MAIDPLTDKSILEGDPVTGTLSKTTPTSQSPQQDPDGESTIEYLMTQVREARSMAQIRRLGTHGLTLVMILLAVWIVQNLIPGGLPETNEVASGNSGVFAASLPTPTPGAHLPALPAFQAEGLTDGVSRTSSYHTEIPNRPRVDVITYTVVSGDSVFGIAERFSLKPETILWGNYSVLADNPHRIQTGQELTILPVDGTYHRWSAGENLEKVAEYYGITAEDILEWPGNRVDPIDYDPENPPFEAGDMLIVPGGHRELVDYGPPVIPRSDPAVARTYGPGHCGTIVEGVIGTGTFLWPANNHFLSGYDYNPSANHPAIDIDGDTGDPIYATDNGVVVYSGWSNNGYGNLIVLDHGNGWQSLYAHLYDVYATCGQSVYQGTTIGALGNTGSSSGSHLHFELIFQAAKVNPWNFLP